LKGHLEIVRLLLGQPSGKATLNHHNEKGKTALWCACYRGGGRVARALLESGADPTISAKDGTTPTAIAKEDPPHPRISAEGRWEVRGGAR
jgi:ankyrin repeat protein